MVGFIFQSKSGTSQTFQVYTAFTFFVQTRLSRIKVNDLKTDPKNRSVFDARTQTKSNSSLFRDGLAMSKSCWSSDESLRWINHGKFLGFGELNPKRSRRKKGLCFFCLESWAEHDYHDWPTYWQLSCVKCLM